jgi:hypothetical protein
MLATVSTILAVVTVCLKRLRLVAPVAKNAPAVKVTQKDKLKAVANVFCDSLVICTLIVHHKMFFCNGFV